MHVKILSWFLVCVGFVTGKPWEEDQFDPELSRFIRPIDLNMEYDEGQAVTFGQAYQTTDISKSKVAKIAGWDRVPEGEASYTAILFNYPDEAKTAGAYPSFELPIGGYCGGVLLTSDTLVTLCACVASWMLWMRKSAGEGDPQQDRAKVLTDYDIPFKDIYVWFGYSYFRPWLHDWRVKLITDPKIQIMNNYWCFEAIDNCPKVNHICQKANPVVLKFDVPWSYTAETLVPWPPSPIYYDKEGTNLKVAAPPIYKQYIKAYHYSYRFKTTDNNDREYYDEYGNWLDIGLLLIDLNKTLVDQRHCVPYDNCLLPGDCLLANKWKLKQGVTCFKGVAKPDLCGGAHGSPVYAADFGLHGLSMNEHPCGMTTSRKEASSVLEVMAITPRMAEYIETLIPDLVDSSKEILPSQHLYRDESDYKMYEMVKYKFIVHDETPHSEAGVFKPQWALYTLALVGFCRTI